MKYPVILKASATAVGLAVLVTSVPTQSSAEEYNICRLDLVPKNIQRKVTRRSDYADILARMFDSCPDAALALTATATAAINTSGRYPESNQNRDPNTNRGGNGDDGGGGNGGGGNGGGGNGGGGNGGGGNGGGGNGGGGNGGGGNGGGGNGGGGNGGGGNGGGGGGGSLPG